MRKKTKKKKKKREEENPNFTNQNRRPSSPYKLAQDEGRRELCHGRKAESVLWLPEIRNADLWGRHAVGSTETGLRD